MLTQAKLKTINELWEDFSQKARMIPLPPGRERQQLESLPKRTFLAGAFATFMNIRMLSDPRVTEDMAEAYLTRLDAELAEFLRDTALNAAQRN